jgi:hypothetical protein
LPASLAARSAAVRGLGLVGGAGDELVDRVDDLAHPGQRFAGREVVRLADTGRGARTVTTDDLLVDGEELLKRLAGGGQGGLLAGAQGQRAHAGEVGAKGGGGREELLALADGVVGGPADLAQAVERVAGLPAGEVRGTELGDQRIAAQLGGGRESSGGVPGGVLPPQADPHRREHAQADDRERRREPYADLEVAECPHPWSPNPRTPGAGPWN